LSSIVNGLREELLHERLVEHVLEVLEDVDDLEGLADVLLLVERLHQQRNEVRVSAQRVVGRLGEPGVVAHERGDQRVARLD
jgi:predicted house-cleaning noncanonical NTP pyrophosphatase (MazG superfamily)